MPNIITDLQRGTTAFNDIELKLKAKGVIGQSEVVPVEDYPDRIDAISPSLGTKLITQNYTYNASDDNLDGYSSVEVNVPSASLGTKSITHNGTYAASSDNLDGYSSVEVTVPLGTKIIEKNGTYDASDDNLEGYSSVDVKVDYSAYNLWNTAKRLLEASEGIKEDGTTTSWSNLWNSDGNNKVHVLVNNITAGKIALLSGHNGSVTYNDNNITLQLGNITFNANIYIDLSNITDYVESITIRSWNGLNIANIIIIDSLSYPLYENPDVAINIGTNSNTMQLDYGIHLYRANSLTTQDLKLPDKSVPVTLYGTFNGDDINIAPIFDFSVV